MILNNQDLGVLSAHYYWDVASPRPYQWVGECVCSCLYLCSFSSASKNTCFTDPYNSNLAGFTLVFSFFLLIFLWQWQNLVPIIQCLYTSVTRAHVYNQSLISVAAVFLSAPPCPLDHTWTPPYARLSSQEEALLTYLGLWPLPQVTASTSHFWFDYGAPLWATSPPFPLAYPC